MMIVYIPIWTIKDRRATIYNHINRDVYIPIWTIKDAGATRTEYFTAYGLHSNMDD